MRKNNTVGRVFLVNGLTDCPVYFSGKRCHVASFEIVPSGVAYDYLNGRWRLVFFGAVVQQHQGCVTCALKENGDQYFGPLFTAASINGRSIRTTLSLVCAKLSTSGPGVEQVHKTASVVCNFSRISEVWAVILINPSV